MDIDKWADRIYLEEDFGKNIATTISGVIGLAIYLYKSDFALAAFVAIILFPTIKILVNIIKERSLKKREILDQENKVKELDETFKGLTDQEKRVTLVFVDYKSSVVSEKYIKLNSIHLPDGAVKSLIQRGFLEEVPYGLSYDLKLNLDVFEAARRYYSK